MSPSKSKIPPSPSCSSTDISPVEDLMGGALSGTTKTTKRQKQTKMYCIVLRYKEKYY